jgi:hypothetical protein
MSPKVIILAGAPSSSSLDWQSPTLIQDFEAPIAVFAGLTASTFESPNPEGGAATTSGIQGPKWRSLTMGRPRLATEYSQIHELADGYLGGGADFFTTVGGASKDSTESQLLLSQFCEHSLVMYEEDMTTEHPLQGSFSDATGPSFLTDSSTTSFNQDFSHPGTGVVRAPIGNAAATWHLSDLEDIPSAVYLLSIKPQTVTVNLIVGIISIAAPRTVNTRWGATISLVEVLVGDETKSGFGITFWLSSDSAKDMIAKLRRQDVVLVQNVALSVFMNKVYSQSLRQDVTKVHLLYRKKLDPGDVGGHYSLGDLKTTEEAHPQLHKTARVREWVLAFVGGSAKGPKSNAKSWDELPDDTQ